MADVTIRGAGIFGLSIAWACVSQGARVAVIDPFGPGAGASGGIVGALAPHVPENWNSKKAFQLESLLMAEGFWTGVREAGGVDPGYGRLGRLQPVADEAALALARQRAGTAAALWRGEAVWEVFEGTGAGFEPASPTGYLIRDTLSARLHPRRGCAALVAALRARGATVERDGEERGIVLHATGAAGLAELSQATGRAVGGAVKGQAALFAFEARDAPQLFVDGLHLVPHADGTLAVGSTSEREFDAATETDGQLDTLIERARVALPALREAPVIERWAGLRPRSRSRAPMLGVHPLFPGQFIANGGFKIGFGMAPKVAEAMAALMLEGRDAIPEAFRVEASM
ncbi:MAG: FAD-dependent oxidoreductase [Pseudooceanicola sp.]|nr:FAD-dependent oxidoreductase [Pseudooceanicola sp.]